MHSVLPRGPRAFPRALRAATFAGALIASPAAALAQEVAAQPPASQPAQPTPTQPAPAQPTPPPTQPAPTQTTPTQPSTPQPPTSQPPGGQPPAGAPPSTGPGAAGAGATGSAQPGAAPAQPAPAAAQAQATQTQVTQTPTLCGAPIGQPSRLPPAGSGPVIYFIAPCFERQGGSSSVEPQTYLYYIGTKPSQPSQNIWIPYDEKAEQQLVDDFRRLWATSFLDDLKIEVTDFVFSNGVVGKLVKYDMEERQRIKIVDYTGSKQLESTKIDEKLKEENVTIRLDSFIDDSVIRRVKSIIKAMLSEKGYLDSKVATEIKPIPGGPKLVNLVFTIEEGPKYKVRKIDFIGNTAIGDGTLKRKMKETKELWFLSFITSRGTYKEDKYAEDAEKVVGHYRDEGYLRVRVENPEIRTIEDSKDKKTRYVEVRVPVTEGPRYKVAEVAIADNKVVKSEALVEIFRLKKGEFYSEKKVRKGMEKARELYGQIGYFEFTAYPEFKFLDLPEGANPDGSPGPQTSAAASTDGAAPDGSAGSGGGAAPRGGSRKPGSELVNVTMHMQEGEQYFVNRITFVGNTTTRDNVIRREMRLVENGVFNTEALKYSVKKINQLGYFKQLEEKPGQDTVKVEKTPNEKNKVDVTLKFEEQNRNQLTFGAGVSQYEGAFAQFAFQTANFLGRGETLSMSVLAGKRYRDYQVSFTEPYLFDRPITGGINVFNRQIRYIGAFTQNTSGGNIMMGFPVAGFARFFTSYSYERVGISELDPAYNDPTIIGRNPFLADALLLNTTGQKRTISKVSPSLVYNTIDNPIFPSSGKRYTLAFDLAGLGGNTSYYKPTMEGIWYFQHTRRTSIGGRAQFQFVAPYRGTTILPIFERLVLGGEYSIRGYDIRTIGPRDEASSLVVGGNKSLLFNGEYLIQVAGPVRLVMFYDAGQVRNDGESFRMESFVASTGAEVRFFMPVLNVPFRLIFARNINFENILDNNFQQEKKWRFRFAVGSTF
jgi:outer membrane protein insertion porin family